MHPAYKFMGAFGAAAIAAVSLASRAQTLEDDAAADKYREFYLFDWLPKKTFDFPAERRIQICNDFRRHDMPLKVRYDDHVARIETGKCRSFDARTIELSAAEPLVDGTSMSGTITVLAGIGQEQMADTHAVREPANAIDADEPMQGRTGASARSDKTANDE